MSNKKLSNEQLVARIRSGADVAENMLKLWQQNKGYICKIINSYRNYAEEDDLQQEGYLGLCDAVEHYEQEEGVPFITYAGYWIRGYIARYIKNTGTIRLPEHMQDSIREYETIVAKWQREFGVKPSDGEICLYMRISQKKLENIRKAAQKSKIESLDVPAGDEEGYSLYDLLPCLDNEEEVVLDRVQNEQLKGLLWPMVDSLPGQQGLIIRMRFQEEKTLKEVGEKIGYTVEGVRQHQAKAIRELRKPSKSKYLRSFLPDSHIYSKALKRNGVAQFNCTWTSSTEYAALGM